MRQVIPSVLHLHRVRVANVFLVDSGPQGRWLIDTGHRLERRTLLKELERAGCNPSSLAGALLTHGHSDHAGNAAFLQARFKVKLFAHAKEAQVLEGRVPRPALSGRGGTWVEAALAKVENHFPAGGTPIHGHLQDEAQLGGMQVHWVPGHTLGSLMVFHPASGSLFSGDSLLNRGPPLAFAPGPQGPYPAFTAQLGLAWHSLRAFQAKGVAYRHLMPGHGAPLLETARQRVDALLRRHP